MDLSHILLVDDEPAVLKALERLLRKHFDVTSTTSPEEALRLLAENEYPVFVTDQRMPTLDGTTLVERARVISPDTRRIILTGHADMDVAMNAINRGAVYQFLLKPWNDIDLVSTLRQAVQHYVLEKEIRRLQEITEIQSAELKAFNQALTEKIFIRTRQLTAESELNSARFWAAIEAMARLTEAGGPVLGGHCKRVAALSERIGRYLGLDEEKILKVKLAGLLHELCTVQLKPKATVRRVNGNGKKDLHGRGADLVYGIPGFEDAAPYIRHCQERFDGNGQPDGLCGKEIPLGARIIAVTDAYDSILNNRDTYVRATSQETLRQIREEGVTAYDPAVVDALTYCLFIEPDVSNGNYEIEIPFSDLAEGMYVARDVPDPDNTILIPSGTYVTESYLSRLVRERGGSGSIGSVFITRRPAERFSS